MRVPTENHRCSFKCCKEPKNIYLTTFSTTGINRHNFAFQDSQNAVCTRKEISRQFRIFVEWCLQGNVNEAYFELGGFVNKQN